MQTFTLNNIPDLDVAVVAALELFNKVKIPSLNIKYKRPLVVGSGNAAATGKIIFEKHDAVFADESTAEIKLKNIDNIDGVVLISASGGKHAPILAQLARKYKKKVTLLTNNPAAPAKDWADNTYVFPKNREPYTYNTSTYLGMILSAAKEDPEEILNFIKKLKLSIPKSSQYYLIVPESMANIIPLLQVKFIELFGRRIARDISTFEYMKHATTVVPGKELFISFGKENATYGRNNLAFS